MKLEPLMTVRAQLKPPVAVGVGSAGNRVIYDVIGGHFEGARLRGTVLSSGADWMILDSDGATGRLDVRIVLETDDGAHIYVQYPGIIEMNEMVNDALVSGTETQFGDTYFMTQPRFEVGEGRYHWLNNVLAVAEGRLMPNAVEYQVYVVANG